MKNAYIQAVLELLKAGKELKVVLLGLDHTLKQHKHLSLKLSILRAVTRALASSNKFDTATLTLGNSADEKKLKPEIEQAINYLAVTKVPEVLLDATLIGGFTLRTKNQILDRSFKTALVKLYQASTK